MRILVVDDEVQIRELLREALQSNGYEVISAPTVPQGLAVLGQKPFDLILIDVNIPGESGVSLVKKIRASRKDLPIVVYSGIVTSELESQLRADGVNEVLDKGLGISVLVEQLGKVLKAKNRLFAGSLPEEKKILIVDDEESVRKILFEFFKEKKYKLYEAANGRQAIEIVRDEKI